jgi:hypothetical protein
MGDAMAGLSGSRVNNMAAAVYVCRRGRQRRRLFDSGQSQARLGEIPLELTGRAVKSSWQRQKLPSTLSVLVATLLSARAFRLVPFVYLLEYDA